MYAKIFHVAEELFQSQKNNRCIFQKVHNSANIIIIKVYNSANSANII